MHTHDTHNPRHLPLDLNRLATPRHPDTSTQTTTREVLSATGSQSSTRMNAEAATASDDRTLRGTATAERCSLERTAPDPQTTRCSAAPPSCSSITSQRSTLGISPPPARQPPTGRSGRGEQKGVALTLSRLPCPQSTAGHPARRRCSCDITACFHKNNDCKDLAAAPASSAPCFISSG